MHIIKPIFNKYLILVVISILVSEMGKLGKNMLQFGNECRQWFREKRV